ncbi:MAG: DUF4838 domain-containing protein, partial [Victivallales bacterium]|nr:DUF4838 domain-containing protein [Victivallales bacterium]
PEILIQTFAYMWSLDAPKTIRPAKNVMMRVCKLGCEFALGKADTMFPVTHPRNKDYCDNFRKWAAIAPNIAVWDYWIIYTKGETTPPYINLPAIREDIKFYSDNHVKTMFVEYENPLNTTFTYFRLWYGLKLMQNPDQPYDLLADRYFNAYYGPAAKPMRQYMEYLQKRQTETDACIGTSPIGFKILIPNKLDSMNLQLLPYLDREFFEKANSLLDKAEALAAKDAACLQHVRKERLPVDIALIYSFGQYVGGRLPVGKRIDATYDALLDRYTDYRMEQARRLFDSDIYPKRPEELKKITDFKELLKQCSKIDASVIPPQFRGKQCIFLRADDWHSAKVADDDAPSKYPMMLKNENSKFLNMDIDKFHRLPFELGIYNNRQELFQMNMTIKAEDIPQDGKYHWIHLGKVKIMPTSFIWCHWSWHLQMPLDAVCIGGDSTWDVHAAIKLTGKPYVKDSTDDGKVFLDSVILVK